MCVDSPQHATTGGDNDSACLRKAGVGEKLAISWQSANTKEDCGISELL